ncbi:PREDICTED: uncharacterized protein LOC108546740 [Eufriesea mexicana]|uniref:uncharacterized protein LOC108546740 n=1 Tax=Eufriesea mexicana TaxID=516756 RepID=UPI00083C7B36|nr:PREDICTED: uncharacterized protein LOC108546740 [Eufriesea mexicana]
MFTKDTLKENTKKRVNESSYVYINYISEALTDLCLKGIRIKTKFDRLILNQSFKVTKTTMKLNTCFLFLLLGATLIQAIPVSKTIEKKSLAEDSKVKITKENLKAEEIGEEKDRSKKAAFCLQIEPGSSQVPQIGLSENQLPIQNIPLTMQTQFVPQQVQTLNLVQPTFQSLPQADIVFPRQIQPIHTLQIVQPSAPIQSSPQTDNVQTDIKSIAKPEPTSTIESEQHATEHSKPMHIKKHPQPLPVPQEALTVLPVVPTYQDHLMLISDNEPKQTTFVQVPTISCNNYLHRTLAECTCQKMEPVAMNMVPIVPYSSTYARSSLVMPHTVANQIKVGPQGRTKTYINVNVPPYVHNPHHLHQQTVFRETNFMLPENSLRNKHILGNSVTSEVNDLIQTKKMPREADSNQLSLKKEGESREKDKTMLLDGRRNTRSNKEETKEQKQQLTKK